MQLSTVRAGMLALLGTCIASYAHADVGFGTTTTLFREKGGPLYMNVLTPSADARADLGSAISVRAGWEADIVSGASVAVVDAPSPGVDVISTATKLSDVRQVVGGGVEVRGDIATLSIGYGYGFEKDYRSHAFDITARTELFERNTGLELSYARGIDKVCNLRQPQAQEAVERERLTSSDGCFESDDRESLDVSLQTFQGGWTQAWTPVLVTQLVLTAQLLNGYQGNPYRGVWLGRTAAQEHHPDNRQRYAAGFGARLWIKPLNGAVQLFGRVYRDTWGIESLTADLGYEWSIGAGLRVRARGRYYTQTSATFYSDNYGLFPEGQYFTGDRELSAMDSVTLGAQFQWTIAPNEEGDVLGFLSSLDLVVKGDLLMYGFDDFHYGQASVPNDKAIIATLGLDAVF